VLLTEPVSEWDDDSFTLHLFHANRGQDFLFAGRYALVTPARGELGAPGERICSWDARHAHPWVTAYWEKQNKGGAEFDGVISDVVGVTVSLLALINSPRIIGRQQHMPSRVLEQKLTRGFGVGKFPLHAWTEIKLEVAKPIEIDDGEPHEAHLTGRRALHFVRKHLRLWNGELIYVTSHWRGDPALGIKQSRYRVVRDANRNDGNNRTT
jgi:hypothetical protein